MGEEQFDAAPFGHVPRLLLTRPYWNDAVEASSSINPAGPVAPPTIDNTDGALLFRAGQVNTVAFLVQLSHEYAEGTDIQFHLHWCKTTNAVGTVLWQYQYTWTNIGDVFPAAFPGLVNGAEFVLNRDTANLHAIFAFPALSGTGKLISSIVKVWLQRTGTGDTYGADAKLISADFHVQCNTLGSEVSQWDKTP